LIGERAEGEQQPLSLLCRAAFCHAKAQMHKSRFGLFAVSVCL
jgi:hypothetical protein